MMESEVEAKSRLRQVLGVSRETVDALEHYVGLLKKWTETINLISRRDVGKIWSRHVVDSLGLAHLMPDSGSWLDLGSGGGLPAIPLALYGRDRGLGVKLCMIESDGRKAAFLAVAVRELDLSVEILRKRVEDLGGDVQEPDFISSRAFASVDKTLEHVEFIVGKRSEILLLKGASFARELTEAQKKWHMSFETIKHPLSLEGVILKIRGFGRAQSS